MGKLLGLRCFKRSCGFICVFNIYFPIHEKGDMYMKTPNRIYVSCHIDTLHKIETFYQNKHVQLF